MNMTWKNRLPWVVVAALALATFLVLSRQQPVQAERADTQPISGPRYSVIETEAHNLIVTDNKTNTLYFYTIDKDKEVGAELKLRGSIDLSQVGKPTIKPVKTGAQK